MSSWEWGTRREDNKTLAKVDGGNLAAYRIVCTLGYHDLAQIPCPQYFAHVALESYRAVEESMSVLVVLPCFLDGMWGGSDKSWQQSRRRVGVLPPALQSQTAAQLPCQKWRPGHTAKLALHKGEPTRCSGARSCSLFTAGRVKG